jgi:hypothetical protein
MIQTTIGELLDGAEFDTRGHRVYLVRDADVVFYIGKSDAGILGRLGEHLGRGGWRRGSPSLLGQLILDNLPASRTWQVELFTVPDCRDAIQKHFPYLKFPERWDSDMAEQALIWEHRPCLNTAHNYDGQKLPERYQNKEDEEAARAAAQLLHIPYRRRFKD